MELAHTLRKWVGWEPVERTFLLRETHRSLSLDSLAADCDDLTQGAIIATKPVCAFDLMHCFDQLMGRVEAKDPLGCATNRCFNATGYLWTANVLS